MPAKRELDLLGACAGGGRWPGRAAEGPATGAAAPARAGRVLIGGVGYTNLRDRSFGPLLIERLPGAGLAGRRRGRRPQLRSDRRAVQAPGRAGALPARHVRQRGGARAAAGTVERYRWQPPTPAVDELQERVAEAVTGVVSLENLLQILAPLRRAAGRGRW